jgi:hypothetical protein
MDRNYIVELIKSSRLQEALKALEKATHGSHLHNDIIAISAAYSEYARQNRSATEDFQTLEIQRAKITNSLLSVLDEISPEDLESIKTSSIAPPPPPAASFNKMYLYGIVGFLALIILFFVFSGGDTVDETANTQTVTQQNNEVSNNNTAPIADLTTDVAFVEYRIQGNKIGSFEQHGATWTENNTVTTFTFKEEKRVDDIIYLCDASRGMYIQLDLLDKQVWMNTAKDPTPKMLYAIVNFGH